MGDLRRSISEFTTSHATFTREEQPEWFSNQYIADGSPLVLSCDLGKRMLSPLFPDRPRSHLAF